MCIRAPGNMFSGRSPYGNKDNSKAVTVVFQKKINETYFVVDVVLDVIRNGKVIDYQQNRKNRGYDTAVVAVPIKINGENYLCSVVVKRALGENKFYLHEVITTKEGTQLFNQGVQSENSELNPSSNVPSINRILQSELNVNAEYSGNSNKGTAVGSASAVFGNKADYNVLG